MQSTLISTQTIKRDGDENGDNENDNNDTNCVNGANNCDNTDINDGMYANINDYDDANDDHERMHAHARTLARALERPSARELHTRMRMRMPCAGR